ncbi:hypothetical protein Aple_020750 [Acrocarpospora pleiomorpha]|uniref:Molecular chaperone DnaK n=1 Tax=Acrocarpospora pleiomorpha TaxID=90975 RepID=A0A5M3XGB9_9ACTN|nr:Hsp70 family protein [Acrocarpospora pleiomorpha]GES19179.1 hypothetical protein Aple_020750 [Acrocarpospora pleiomorpha]
MPTRRESVRRYPCLGVDFGTSGCAAAVDTGSGPVPLTFPVDGSYPSAALWSPHGWISGADALARVESGQGQGIRSPKLMLAHDPRAPLPVITGDGGVELFSLPTVIAAVFGTAFARCAELYGTPASVVLTHPASWTAGGPQLEVLREAARLAGHDQVEWCSEPEAVARGMAGVIQDGEVVACYDLGGGTCELSIQQRTENGWKALAQSASLRVGGEDFDASLLDLVVTRIGEKGPRLNEELERYHEYLAGEETGTEPNFALVSALIHGVRAAKHQLSTSSRASVIVPQPISAQTALSRADVDRIGTALLEESIRSLTQLTGQAGVAVQNLTVLVSGQAAQVPIVTDLLVRAGFAVRRVPEPKTVVAVGAAWVNPPPPPAPPPPPPPEPKMTVLVEVEDAYSTLIDAVWHQDGKELFCYLLDKVGKRLRVVTSQGRQYSSAVDVDEVVRMSAGRAGVAVLGRRTAWITSTRLVFSQKIFNVDFVDAFSGADRFWLVWQSREYETGFMRSRYRVLPRVEIHNSVCDEVGQARLPDAVDWQDTPDGEFNPPWGRFSLRGGVNGDQLACLLAEFARSGTLNWEVSSRQIIRTVDRDAKVAPKAVQKDAPLTASYWKAASTASAFVVAWNYTRSGHDWLWIDTKKEAHDIGYPSDVIFRDHPDTGPLALCTYPKEPKLRIFRINVHSDTAEQADFWNSPLLREIDAGAGQLWVTTTEYRRSRITRKAVTWPNFDSLADRFGISSIVPLADHDGTVWAIVRKGGRTLIVALPSPPGCAD